MSIRLFDGIQKNSVYIKNVTDTGQIIAFTANEALENDYCEAIVENTKELLAHAEIDNYEISKYEPTKLEDMVLNVKTR